ISGSGGVRGGGVPGPGAADPAGRRGSVHPQSAGRAAGGPAAGGLPDRPGRWRGAAAGPPGRRAVAEAAVGGGGAVGGAAGRRRGPQGTRPPRDRDRGRAVPDRHHRAGARQIDLGGDDPAAVESIGSSMPPRRKTRLGQDTLPGIPTMAELRDTLWKAADKLRGSMDAAQYKEFVLGLVFLKYVSDAFAERREQIRSEVLADGIDESQVDQFLDDPDEYRREGVFWVPEPARWSYLAERAKSGTVGELLDNAMDAVMKSNPSLVGVLPKIFNRDNVDQRRLAELVDLVSDARFTGHGERPARDVLGEVYEYFLEKFARAGGKRGGEFYTPQSVVKLLVEMLEPYSGRVYDPCCGSGGMFVQAEKFVLKHQGRLHDIAVYGQESNERTWRLAKMNLAIHGISGDLGPRWEDTFHHDHHPDLKFDFILANPPFNMSDWTRKVDDQRWRFGVPPAGNANFAWMQH